MKQTNYVLNSENQTSMLTIEQNMHLSEKQYKKFMLLKACQFSSQFIIVDDWQNNKRLESTSVQVGQIKGDKTRLCNILEESLQPNKLINKEQNMYQ